MTAPGAETATGRLNAILADTLTSTYIDDDYYALLRADTAEWKARGVPLTEAERAEYEALLLHEAWLLDRRAFEDSPLYREAFGDGFVDWLLGLKDFEINRFTAAEGEWDPDNVSAWEHREYFAQY